MSRNRKTHSNIPKQEVKTFVFNISIKMQPDGSLHINPHYNRLAINSLDERYLGVREDYDASWTDDHKIAYCMCDVFDGIFSTYEDEMEEIPSDPTTLLVRNLNESPVRDVIDISTMKRV